MNAFENIVKLYLEEEGYWVRQRVKVDISKEDKKAIGLPTMPRPEIDLVALNVKGNELLLIEVKSLLDSYGVWYEAVSGDDKKFAKRYRLFTDSKYRKVVTNRLREAYLKQGLINGRTTINYGLAAGNIHPGEERPIREYFLRKRWKLFTPQQIKEKIRELSTKGYEDDVITMTAKLIRKKDVMSL